MGAELRSRSPANPEDSGLVEITRAFDGVLAIVGHLGYSSRGRKIFGNRRFHRSSKEDGVCLDQRKIDAGQPLKPGVLIREKEEHLLAAVHI